ncbi:MAG: hypothetical protein H6729_07525 [Deltaproteobacteria bacterium]|nr:hypothetical protein [Deltaproteobacteria bacterium]
MRPPGTKADPLELECDRIFMRTRKILAEIAFHQPRATRDPAAFLRVRALRREFWALRKKSGRYREVLRDEAEARAERARSASHNRPTTHPSETPAQNTLDDIERDA